MKNNDDLSQRHYRKIALTIYSDWRQWSRIDDRGFSSCTNLCCLLEAIRIQDAGAIGIDIVHGIWDSSSHIPPPFLFWEECHSSNNGSSLEQMVLDPEDERG